MIFNETHEFFWPFFTGVIICILSWIAGLILIWMDKESDRRESNLRGSRMSIVEEENI
jgi:hypothetical protein